MQERRPLSVETRQKISTALQGRALSLDTRKKISATKMAQRVSEQPDAIHRWLRRWHPKSGVCDHCQKPGKTDYASLTDHSYTRDRADYAELCPSCHLKLDYASSHRVQKGRPHRRNRVSQDA